MYSMKKLLSLIFSFCLVLSCSVPVFAYDSATYPAVPVASELTKYVNSTYAGTQRLIVNIDNSVANVEVFYFDNEDIYPAVVIDDNEPIPMVKGDYSYSLVVNHPKKNTVIGLYTLSVVDLNADNALIDFTQIGINPSGDYIISSGSYAMDNSNFRSQYMGVLETDIIDVSDVICSKSNEICKGITKDVDKAYAIYAWVTRNIAYDMDALNNNVPSLTVPEEILSEGYAVCEGLSLLYRALCNAQDIPCRVFTGTTSNAEISNSSGGHAWNEFYSKGAGGNGLDWYFVDCTPSTFKIKVNGKIKDRFTNVTANGYSNDNYFMPMRKMVNDYVKYSSFYENYKESIGLTKYSDWAESELHNAIYSGLLPEDFHLDDYRTPATREYFCGIVARYVWCEISKEKSDMDANKFLGSFASLAPDMKGLDFWTTQFCAGAELVYGKGDEGFCPNDYISRAEAATIIHRLSKLMTVNGYDFSKYDLKEFSDISSKSYFVDHKDIPEWALDGCYGCKDKSIIKGDDLGRFLPNDKLSAEQCIVIFSRLLSTK